MEKHNWNKETLLEDQLNTQEIIIPDITQEIKLELNNTDDTLALNIAEKYDVSFEKAVVLMIKDALALYHRVVDWKANGY